MESKKLQHSTGFTIVELLIVIVVIGILAAITIVAYNGIQQRAVATSLTSDLDNGSKLLKLFQVDNNAFPATINCAIPDSTTNKCINSSANTTYQYIVNNTNPQTFCITASRNTQNYSVSPDGTPLGGSCPTARFDVSNTASYPGTGTVLTDLSGNATNGTLVNGVGYSNVNGGVLTFDGVDDRVETTIQATSNNMTWSAWVNCSQSMDTHNMFMGKHLPYFGMYGGNSLIFSINIGGTQRSITTNSNLSLNTWYYTTFTIVYDGINTTMNTYINGDLAKSAIWAGAQVNYSSTFTIGDGHTPAPTPPWYPFKGMVSSVKVYDRTLSTDEIQQNFNSTRGKYGI